MVSSGEAPSEVGSEELRQRQSPDSGTGTTQLTTDKGVHASRSPEGIPLSITPEKSFEDAVVSILPSDKESIVSSVMPVKVLGNPSPRSHSSHSAQEGRTPSIIREKVSEDGYHWRKYGQKLVKGNEFVRSYYKCTHPSCQVKKQLECSHDGHIEDIVYFGEHEHSKPQANLPLAVAASITEEKPVEPLTSVMKESQAPQHIESTNTRQASTITSREDVKSVLSGSNKMRDEVDNDDDPRSKRQKKGNRKVDTSSVDKATGESRLVVQTLSEVDIVNDGYRWRKYGQKMVKGSPNPRSYYRCSTPGCPAKKHVERAPHDSKVVITSYEGQHVHDMPPSRTITHNTFGANICTTAIPSGESGTKSAETVAPPSADTVVYNSLDSDAKSKKLLKSAVKREGIESGHAAKSNEQQDGESGAIKESGPTGVDMAVNPSSISEGQSNMQHNEETRTEAAENRTASGVISVTKGRESNPNEQHMPKSETVQS